MDGTYYVRALWDAEAAVWYVSDSNVPGLATEADTVDELIKKLRVMVTELLELNGVIEGDAPAVPFSFTAQVDGDHHVH